jgi:hypothetical protein
MGKVMETIDKLDNLTFVWLDEPNNPYRPQVDQIISERGWIPLNSYSRVLSAIHNDLLVGFFVFQAIPYCGPLFIEPKHRGTDVVNELTVRMLDFLREHDCRGFIVTPESRFSEKQCQQYGMTLLHQPVYFSVGVPSGNKRT